MIETGRIHIDVQPSMLQFPEITDILNKKAERKAQEMSGRIVGEAVRAEIPAESRFGIDLPARVRLTWTIERETRETEDPE